MERAETAAFAEEKRKNKKKPLQVGRERWDKHAVIACIMAIIPLIGFILFSIFPLVISFLALFCNVDLYDLSNIKWNNCEGFQSVFVPGHAFDLFGFDVATYFYKACGITLWVASTQFITLAISIVISAFLAQKLKGSRLFQVLFFIPYICSGVAVAMMWRWVFADTGILNAIFGSNVKWLTDVRTMTLCIITAIIWQAPGYGIVMYKSAMNDINASLYEAAALDGANGFQKFIHVTVPCIAPTTFYLLISGIGAGLLTCDMALLIVPDSWETVGGNGSMGLTLMRFVYYLIQNDVNNQDAFGNRYMVSCAAIISWVLFALTAVFSVILFKRRQKSME